MADKTVTSKTLSIELDTGQTKRTEITGRGTRSFRSTPITVKVPNLSTVTNYNVDDKGNVTNAEISVRQKVSREIYNDLDEADRSSVSTRSGRASSRTDYYAILARKARDSNNYITTNAVDKVFTSARDASLFKKAAADHSKERQRSTFSNFDKATNDAIKKAEGLKDSDAKNQTNLAGGANAAEQQKPVESESLPQLSNSSFTEKRTNFGNSKYPEDISDTQDRILFTMYEYGVKQGVQALAEKDQIKLVTGFGAREFKKSLGTVTLPIQNQISDSNRVDWGAGQLNAIQASLATSLQAFDGDIGETFKNFEGNAKALAKGYGAGDISKALKIFFIQEAIGTKNLLSRVSGGILNPNVELLFRGPTLRPFNFRFFLSARSDTETTQIKRIIRFFKEGMAVKNSSTDLFLKAPNAFEIKYEYGKNKGDHPGLNKIKKCALIACNVDYTPDNSYMTFEDGTMTAYGVTLQFQELEPITSDDYADYPSLTDIGY